MKNWIPIKVDYVIDHFENILSVLSEDDFDTQNEELRMEPIIKLEDAARNLLDKNFGNDIELDPKIL